MGKREIRSGNDFWNLIEEVAAAKKKQAAAKHLRVDPTLENSKDVVAAFSRGLYERFAADGFKYTPSNRVMKRVVGDWTQEVVFDGHGGNTRGRKIHFKVWSFAKNAPWKKWRQALPTPFYLTDIVAVPARQIDGWEEQAYWDLHEKRDRAAITDEAEKLIRAKLLPMFELFADHGALRKRIMSEQKQHTDRLVELDCAIDLMLYYFQAPAAAEVLDEFAARHADQKFMAEALARVRSGWRPRGHSGSEYNDVALAMETYRLPVKHPMLVTLRRADLPKVDPTDDGSEARRQHLLKTGATIAPTQPAPDRETYARNRAAELRREMNDSSLPIKRRQTAAHNACEMQEIAGPDDAVWELLAESIKLGLVNRRAAIFKSAAELVKRLAERSTPPKEFQHVPDAFLR